MAQTNMASYNCAKTMQPSSDMFNYYLTMNINNICRICLEKGPKLMPIFDQIKPRHFSILIMACASVQVIEGDGLPPYICQKCISRLNIAFQFKSQCESSDARLRACFENLNHMPPTPDLTGFMDIKKDSSNTYDQNQLQNNHLANTTNQIQQTDDMQDIQVHESSNNGTDTDDIQRIQVQTLQNVQLEAGTSLQDIVKSDLTDLKIEFNDLKPADLDLKVEDLNLVMNATSNSKLKKSQKHHQCDTCGKVFRTKPGLIHHIRIHTGERPYVCHLCDKRFINGGHLHTHMRTHTGEKNHICAACNKAFATAQQLTKHTIAIHTSERPYACTYCAKSRLATVYVTSKCKSFLATDGADLSTMELNSGLPMDLKPMEMLDYFCDINLNTLCRVCLEKHQPNKEVCNIFEPCNKSVDISHMLMACASVQVMEGDGLPSSICRNCMTILNVAWQFKLQCENSDIKLRQFYANQQQLDVGHDVGRYNLNIKEHDGFYETKSELQDGDSFTQSNSSSEILHTPVAQENSPEENVEKKSKIHKKPPRQKLPREPKEPKVHQCDTCGKTFNRREYLTQHIRIHTGEKPYRCHLCEKRFVNSGHLTTHMRKHTGERPHNCTLCPKAFSTRQELQKHIMVHNGVRPFVCKMCNKSFGSSSNLYSHLKHHTGEKNFTCESCGKTFYTKQELKQHLVVHTGEKAFLCEFCNKRFSQIAHLRRHSKLHKT